MIDITKNSLHIIKQRPLISHKGTFGKLLIIAGSKNMGGAAIISSSAAVYSGTGLVTVATEPSLFNAINSSIPEVMTIDYFNEFELINTIRSVDVILIGPGLTPNKSNELVNIVANYISKPQTLIVDASALNSLSTNLSILTNLKCNLIFTPHQMEWQRLSKISIAEQSDLKNLEFINQLPINPIVVLKSHQSKIYYKNNTYLNIAGNPGLATGGSGDSLAGIIAAFVCQFGSSVNSVIAATYLHSDLANQIYKDNFVVLPEILIKKIPNYMKKVVTIN